MAGRSFTINGETMVAIKFGAHLSGFTNLSAQQTQSTQRNLNYLGLAVDEIKVSPTYYHHDVQTDDFGPSVPAEIQANLADCRISMTLSHYDNDVLDVCLAEAMGAADGDNLVDLGTGDFIPPAGVMNGAGNMLGHGLPLQSSGNHFISLGLLSPQLNFPYRFVAAYLERDPLQLPLGVKYSKTVLNWRAIPYQPLFVPASSSSVSGAFYLDPTGGNAPLPYIAAEIQSSGAVIWDHETDF